MECITLEQIAMIGGWHGMKCMATRQLMAKTAASVEEKAQCTVNF
tara:strand:- start:335 stop:469 length:135 start_codon:yes stop_codon:yes gene_type:complete